MIDQIKLRWVYLVSILFILANAYLVYKEYYWGFIIPVVLLLIILYIYSLDKVLLIIVFATPLAVIYRDPEYGAGISLPTEPLLAGILLVFLLRELYLHDFDKRVWKHPLSLVIIFNLFWMLVTTFTSENIVVSLKFFLARLWFVIPCYFVISQFFKEKKNIHLFIWFYVIPLIGVVFYTIYNHSLWGFEEDPGHWVMTPFYNDHTAYGAILAIFIPITVGLCFNRDYNKTMRLVSFIASAILVLAIFLSYSRAAWVSVVAALLLMVLIVFKIRLRTIFLMTIGAVALFVMFQNQIFMKLEKNKQDSSSNIVEHIQSISNISSDASNLERINRWKSAIRMFNERPVLGWGPGTYQFLYAPFQNSQERTIISTNAGDRGNAHSEYIGPLAESGVLGMLSFIAIAVLIMFTGIRVYQRAADREIRLISLLIVLGIFTYLIHGLLNNFLDSDKASVPFWGLAAVLVAMDLYMPRKTTEEVTT
ncbi:MAG: O-antigen ligase family protein [Bacteroidetes bacterium]|nr:O-antigen ligase family protein [Bacteroidota bacterium]